MILGSGDKSTSLSSETVQSIIQTALAEWNLAGQKVLVIIPDGTRTAPLPLFFRTITDLLRGKVKKLDFMVALGTHHALSDLAINSLLGIDSNEKSSRYADIQVFNHQWDNLSELVTLGIISPEESSALSGGLLPLEVKVSLNRRVLEYDSLIICGPVFPHEVVGFSGGNKYLFPGISSPAMINYTHWLGALLTSPATIGEKNTPVRAVINYGATMLEKPVFSFCFVVGNNGLQGLYAGLPELAWSQAADLSAQVHIRKLDRPMQQVLALLPTMYEDLWVGGKGMYKTEPVIADGGEVIIYAPHIREVSYTHGHILEEIGYHVRDYFLYDWEKFKSFPWGVLAHSTHVKGLGSYENGKEKPRITVTIASQIPESEIKALNLNYRDPNSIFLPKWENREDEGILVVPHAGEILYRLQQ